MKNKFKILMYISTLVMLVLTLVGCGSKEAKKKIIKIGIGLNEQSPQYKGLEKFKELIEKDSNGKYEVQLYANSQLGDDTKMMQSLKMGTQEMTCPSTSPISSLNKQFMVFDLPFLFPNENVADKVLDSEFGEKMLKSLEKEGIIGLAYWENGFRDLTNSKREVKTPEDMKGLKIRTMENPVHIASFEALGAIPTPMPFGELFTAMQQKIIDGEENPLTTVYLQKFYEVQNYVSLTHHFYTPFVFMISKKTWDGMLKEDQEMFRKAAKEAGAYERKVNREQMAQMEEKLAEQGMKVTKLTPEEHQMFVEKTAGVISKFENEIGKDVVQSMLEEIKKASN